MTPPAPSTATQTWTHRVWPLCAFHFAFIAGATQLKTAGNALVLSRFDASVLPYLYLAGAVAVAALTLWPRSDAAARSESPTFLALVGAAASAALAAGVWAGSGVAVLLLYLFAEVGTTYASIRFWSRAGAAFDARESRRAFTLLNGLGMGGGMAGGLLIQAMAEPLGIPALLLSGAGMLALAALAFRFHQGPLPAPRSRARLLAARSETPWGSLLGHPYPRRLTALVLVLSVLSALADYLFRLRAEGQMGEAQLAALFGTLQVWLGLACVVFQLLVAERLLARVGILRYLAAVPLALAPLAVAALLLPGLWPAYLLRLMDTALSYSILPVGMQLLYAAMPEDSRDGLRATLDGLVRKLGVALAALALIAAGRAATAGLTAAAVLALCAAVGLVLLRLRPAYLGALGSQVGAELGEQQQPEEEEGEAQALARALRSEDAARALHALQVMEERDLELRPHVLALFSHPSPAVQERGVVVAGRLRAREAAGALERLTGPGPLSLRVQAVWALGKVAPERSARVLTPLLRATEPSLRAAAIGALLRTSHPVDALAALRSMVARGAEATVEERTEVAHLLGRIQDARYAPLLGRFLNDASDAVRRAAVEAVGEGGYGELAARLLPCLTQREVRAAAREALAALGDKVTALLELSLNNRTAPLAMRLELPRVLRAIGTPAALEALLFSNVRDDARLHHRIGVELGRLREEHPEHPVDAGRVRQALGRRRETYRSLVTGYRDLRAGLGEASLLTRAVGDRLDQALELSFSLLGLLHPAQAMRRIHQHLVGEDPKRRAYALELLENLVPEEDRELVAEQVEAHHRLLPEGSRGALPHRLVRLALGEDLVLRACARHVAHELGLGPFPPEEFDMSEATVERMFLLQEVPIFSQADVDDVAAVAAMAREVRFARGERVFSQGDPGDALYVVIEGAVDAVKGGQHILRMGARQAFGDVSLLDGAPRPTDVVAAEDTRALVIDRRDLMDLIQDRPELLQGLFRYVAAQLRAFVDRKPTGEIRAVS